MRIDWQHDNNAPTPCRVINKDTGKQIAYCAMADEETGEYLHYVHDANTGRFVMDPETERVKMASGLANLEIQILKPGEPYHLVGA